MTTPTHPTHDQEALRVRKPQAEVDTPQADVPAPHVPPVVALQGVVGKGWSAIARCSAWSSNPN
ncbi:MAG: hypothetical protein MUF38_20250 [Anaerolineae bacterium]|nr:hypothetical protein [Anaerolineae bacterium]